jgi:hypothetical protein
MKYTVAGITQQQSIRVSPKEKINIAPSGGELSEKDVDLMKKSPYGKKLIAEGVLKIEGVKPGDILPQETKAPATPAKAPAAPAKVSAPAAVPGASPAAQGTDPASVEVKK